MAAQQGSGRTPGNNYLSSTIYTVSLLAKSGKSNNKKQYIKNGHRSQLKVIGNGNR